MGTGLYCNLHPRFLQGAISLLPDFLVPAVSVRTTSRSFSRTSKCESRLAMSPLSLPPEVNMRVLDPPKRRAISRIPPPKVVEVEGPLGLRFHAMLKETASDLQPGKITQSLPLYLTLEHDQKKRKAVLKILDRRVRKHREMWGT